MLRVLFIFGFSSILGWVIEAIYRCIMSKKIVNPGFMGGCVLPIYGFGALILYYICKFGSLINVKYNAFIIILISIILLTLLEYISGLFLLKFFKLKLWDYSNRKFNINGLICLRFTLYWGILALIFYLFIYSFIDSISEVFINNKYCLLFLGIFYGVFFIDLFLSINLLGKIKKYAKSKSKIINLEKLRYDIITRISKNKFLNRLYPYLSTSLFLNNKIKDDKNDL